MSDPRHPIRARLADARLYLCTDARRDPDDADGEGLLDFVERALVGGVDIVQLRDKGTSSGPLEAREELAILARLRALTTRHGALLAVNDRADIAALSGADVLHVGQGDLSAAQARRIVGGDVVIGQSTHDDAQMCTAVADPDVDYFCVGPCWSTPTKPGRAASGLGLVSAAAATGTAKPWFAIGGIDLGRVPEVVDAGADRIVVVRAITGAADPTGAASALRAAMG